jgi:enoyl-CoA hydratase
MAHTRIEVERQQAVARVTLHGAEGNRLSETTLGALAARLAALADDAETRVVLLAGEGATFCSGWDEETRALAMAEPDAPRRLAAAMQAVVACPLPLIALVRGEALDGGLELALACDVRLAETEARFGFPSSTFGVPPLAGGVARVARLAGRGMALRLLLTGEAIGADEALACGLVSGVVSRERLAAEGERLASVIAARGPIATRFAKEAVSRGTEMPLDQALRFETDLTIILQATADRAEGVRAFAEKRPPRFVGE